MLRKLGFLSSLFGLRSLPQDLTDTSEQAVRTHVVILDGTMSSLREGQETNAGLTYKLTRSIADDANMLVHYEAGIQWNSWRDTRAVIEARGINQMIARVYGELSTRYRPGDRIYLFGYSRGAYAVRSLAGFIDRIGLLREEHALERRVRRAYTYYQRAPHSDAAQQFKERYTHGSVPIQFLGVWDTVAAVGIHLPLLWRFSSVSHSLHDYYPPRCVEAVYHALAHDERRVAFSPVLFQSNPDRPDQILEQMWFPGVHGDVGGQLTHGVVDARKLPNATLVWMVEKAEARGLVLPSGWRTQFPHDAHGESIGAYRGLSKLFLKRQPREVGRDASEVLHPALKS